MKIDSKDMANWASQVTKFRSENTSDEDISLGLKKAGIPATLEQIDEHISSWANVFRTAGQGLSFGFGDEITAGIKSAFGDQTYDEAVAEERQKIKNYATTNPAKAMGLEVAGALPTMFVPGLGQARAASLGGRLGKAALQGGAEGGLYGLGTGEGDFVDRAKSGGQGAVFGAGGGTLMRGGMELVAPTVKKAWARALGTSADQQKAKNVIRDTARYDGGPEEIINRAQNISPGRRDSVVLGDLGENLQTTTSAASNITGDAMTRIQPHMKTREAGAAKRVIDGVRKALSTKKPFGTFMADEIQAITKKQQLESGPVYREAFDNMDLSGRMPELKVLASHPLIKKAATYARDFVEPGEKFDLKKMSNPRTWDLVKRGLNRLYEQNDIPMKGPNATAGQVAKRLDNLLSILDSDDVDPMGLYRTARQTFAEPAQLKQAMTKGYDLFRVSNTNKIGFGLQDVSNMSKGELEGFVRGVGFSVRDLIQEGAESAAAIRRTIKGPKKEILKAAIGDDKKFNTFINELDDEIMMFETSSQLLKRGQSRTEPLRRAIDDLLVKTGGKTRFSAEGILSTLASRIVDEGAETSKNRVIGHLADMLMTPTTDMKAISKLLKWDAVDQIFNGVNAIVGASVEKAGRRVGAEVSEQMGVMY